MTETMERAAVFAPPQEFEANASVTGEAYQQAQRDRLAFWAAQAGRLTWSQRWSQVLDSSNAPFYRWFVGGRLNAATNCLDRHIAAGLGDRVAIHWEGEPGDSRTLTYAELHAEVCRAANALTGLGVRAGDRVAIYLPMIPEAVVAMLACARLGAPHSVVFGGFSVDALAGRIADAEAKLIITADGGYRRGVACALKPAADAAADRCPSVEQVLVVRRTGQEIEWRSGRDRWWHEVVDAAPAEHTAESFDAEHPLFILYTSGTTGRPKGILHTTGGYLTHVGYTFHAVFDHKPESDVYWCTADVGWVTGHSYLVYGPLANAATQVMYEGAPDAPHRGRFWELVEKYRVTILYTAPTAIRTFMKWGSHIPEQFDLSSLRLLGSVGEPINPEAWLWYRRHIGRQECPIVDTWWQTETGGMMISPLPGVTATKPGSAMRPLPGISAAVVDEDGDPVANGNSGSLLLTEPWPGMMRTIWGDDRRYVETYWARFPGRYLAGDRAYLDEDGDLWLRGRIDDVMLIAGHNISTTEVESALGRSPKVAESAVVGASDPTTGQAIVAFVMLRGIQPSGAELAEVGRQLRMQVRQTLGPIASPKQIIIVPELPKTRSGKIMRRLLRDVAERRPLGDTTTLQDTGVMSLIASNLSACQPAAGEA